MQINIVCAVIVGLVIITCFSSGVTKLAQHISNNAYLHFASHLLRAALFCVSTIKKSHRADRVTKSNAMLDLLILILY
jgi:hypothetical protein